MIRIASSFTKTSEQTKINSNIQGRLIQKAQMLRKEIVGIQDKKRDYSWWKYHMKKIGSDTNRSRMLVTLEICNVDSLHKTSHVACMWPYHYSSIFLYKYTIQKLYN